MYQTPRVSPDGRQLAVGIDDGKEANVWVYDLSGTSAIRRLTFGGKNRFPIWTSDSARIAFQSDREGDSAIFWQRADGTGAAERITRPDQGQAHMPNAWSPKGDSFLFSVSGSNESLWTFSLADKKAAPFGAVRSSQRPNAMFSPDGRWVAYASNSNEAGLRIVFVQPFPATGATYQIADGTSPLWAPDGKELFFSIGAGVGSFLVVSVKTQPTFAVGNPTPVPRPGYVGRPDIRNYDIAPDGNHFVIVVDASDATTGSAPQIQVVLDWFEELRRRVPVK